MPQTALVIIDIQNDYFPGGAFPLEKPEQAAAQAARVLAYFRERALPVIHVQHSSIRPGSAFFLPGTPGADIHPTVSPLPGETVVVKHAPSAFLETTLTEELARCGARHLVIVGMMSHMCVDTTVRVARERGFALTLLHDACATRSLAWEGQEIAAAQVHAAYMAALNGYFAEVMTTDAFLQAEAAL